MDVYTVFDDTQINPASPISTWSSPFPSMDIVGSPIFFIGTASVTFGAVTGNSFVAPVAFTLPVAPPTNLLWISVTPQNPTSPTMGLNVAGFIRPNQVWVIPGFSQGANQTVTIQYWWLGY